MNKEQLDYKTKRMYYDKWGRLCYGWHRIDPKSEDGIRLVEMYVRVLKKYPPGVKGEKEV